MGGLHRLVVSLAAALGIAAAASSAGCRYQNMNSMGTISAAPYTNLECFEPGNPEGFSLEVPECECNAGMRLRYFAAAHGGDVHYEYESNFRNDDSSDDIRVILSTSREVREVYVGGRLLPSYDQCSDIDRMMLELATESSRSMLENYSPVMDDAALICTQDQLDRQFERMVAEQQ